MASTYTSTKINPAELSPKQKAEAELERRRRARLHIPENEKMAESFIYFCMHYCQIYDATQKRWIPFELWTEQAEVANMLLVHLMVIILKARQLGMTWLVLAYALWLMIFHPAATVLLFSLRDTEAVYLLGEERLRGMYKKLPVWCMMRKIDEVKSKKAGKNVYDWVTRTVEKDDGHIWVLGNGSNARAFPTSAGDSYTATLAVVDEADLVPDLDALMLRVQPTIDGGGQMIMLSKSNKKLPQSTFKKIYKNAKAGLNSWKSVFLAWWVRPQRTQAWYDAKARDAMAKDDALDDVYENYPATDAEALAPASKDKRIPFKFIEAIYSEEKPVELKGAPPIPGLKVFIPPRKGKKYVIGGDPAEGNPTSDDSGIQVVDAATGAQCAVAKGKYDVDVMALYVEYLSAWYNDAPALIERNNHGHAVLANLRNTRRRKKVRLILDEDKKQGHLSNKRTKIILYDDLTQTISTGDCMIFDVDTQEQIASIEGSTLLAPPGMKDDLADSFAIAQKARALKAPTPIPAAVGGQRKDLDTYRPNYRAN